MRHPSRWYLLPMVAALAATPLRHADAQLVSFGLMAGLSQSTFTGNAIQDAKNAGFIAGAFVRLGALGFAVQPGLYYSEKGAKFQENTPEENTTKLGYIQIPIVIRIHMGPLYVGAGPSIGLKMSCTNAPTSGASSTCADSAGAKSTEVSGIVEAGVEFRHLSLGARADIGLTNAVEAISTGNTNNVGYKTQTVSVVVAYRF